MLKFKNVKAFYSKTPIISVDELNIYDNKINTIIGLNGSGKTSLISTLFDNIKYEGEIYLDDKLLCDIPFSKRALEISLCPQIKESINFNTYDLVSLARYPYNGNFKGLNEKDKEIIKQSMESTNTYQFKDKDISSLSGGERQRVYLAMCLAQNTKYIVLDEPTTFLDIVATKDFMNALKKMNKTFLIIIHDLSLALQISDYITIVASGNVIGTYTKEDIIKKDIIEKYFKVKKYIIDDKIFFA